MTDNIYKVLFEGQILPNHEEDSVKENLSRLFKADDHRMQRLFSGKPYALRKNISKNDARKYQKIIKKAGGICRIVSMDGEEELKSVEFESSGNKTTGSLFSKFGKQLTSEPSEPLRLMPRIGRCQYISLCWLIGLLVTFTIMLPEYLPYLAGGLLTIQQTVSITFGFYALALLMIIWAMVGRLNDMNCNGVLWLFIVIPIVNFIFLLWLAFGRGTKGVNGFGTDPRPPGLLTRVLGLHLPLALIATGAAFLWLYQDDLMILIQTLPVTLSEQTAEHFPLRQYLPEFNFK